MIIWITGILILVLAVWAVWYTQTRVKRADSDTLTYTNTVYGFEISYPKDIKPQESFTSHYHLPQSWRVEAIPNEPGTPVVTFPIFSVDRGDGVATGKPYPIYFTAEVRIGVSEMADTCYAPDPGYEEQVITNETINGIPFKKFEFGSAGMMQYVEGNSYRTIHNGKCYVIEQVKAGSTYRDDTMREGIPEVELQEYYEQGEGIVRTFTFI